VIDDVKDEPTFKEAQELVVEGNTIPERGLYDHQ
jgi:hypothetical protein